MKGREPSVCSRDVMAEDRSPIPPPASSAADPRETVMLGSRALQWPAAARPLPATLLLLGAVDRATRRRLSIFGVGRSPVCRAPRQGD